MDNQQTIQVYNQYVQEYVSKFMDLDLYKDTFDHFLKFIPAGGKVLELGCGPGNVVKYLKSRRNDLDILGIDLAPEMIKEAKIFNADSRFELWDIRDVGQIKERFDAIVGAFCLPYISSVDVDDLFINLQNLTFANGMVYLSFMEGPRERSGFEKTSFTGESEIYINYYERRDIEARLKQHRFTVEAFFTKDYPETDGSNTIDIIYVARR